jgi:hypothetical protein
LQKLPACQSLKDAVVTKFAPTQLGFGVGHSAEAAEHAARIGLYIVFWRTWPTWAVRGKAMVKIDFKTVFSTLRRD